MNFDFEISRVDCISKENNYSQLIIKKTFERRHLSVFPFYIWDGLWGLIRPVPEVSLLF